MVEALNPGDTSKISERDDTTASTVVGTEASSSMAEEETPLIGKDSTEP